MEGNLELSNLIKTANTELKDINDELETQTEKLKGVQQKLGVHRATLENNWTVLKKLEESTRMEKILKTLATVFIIFTVLFSITEYAEFTIAFNRKFPESWNQFKRLFFK